MAKVLVVVLFSIGLWGLIGGENIIRKIIGLSLMNSAVVALFVIAGRIDGRNAPILVNGLDGPVVDPIPQALMLTAIVVGLSVTAGALILAVRLFRTSGTLDIERIEDREITEGMGKNGH